ncbi:MAG: DUF2878 domain-containing protein [Wenzhouxiangella sp.]|jgi:hypothetical protein|nr:DUF2878 domain-containing protein [Wenzhouxiangella sp.]
MQFETSPPITRGLQRVTAKTAPLKAVIINALLFNLVWAACVIGAARGHAWIGGLAATAMVGAHLWQSSNRHSELRLILATAAIGFSADSILAATGLLQYETGIMTSWLAPIWILSLWFAFGTTLNLSLRWLKHRRRLAMALGAVSGPLSYFSGSRLGAVGFADTTLALIVLSVTWAILLPALMQMATHSQENTHA